MSPTLGKDSLKASLFAGLVGIALLVVVLILFYRRLTLLIAMGMIVWGMLIYSVSVFISQTTNYALTLAGVTGIIVSIGMTVDSYVVYFERMKDEVLHGRTFKNSAARSFRSTWKTILAANLVSFIAAAVLFVLSVGSVRGFALYLGVTTICDVIVLWFFTRPAVILMAEHRPPRRPRPVRHRADARAGRRRRTRRRPRPQVEVAHERRSRPSAATVMRPVAKSRWRRLILAQTAIDFWGRRRLWLGISALLIVASMRLVRRRAASCSASTSRAACRGTSRPAS